MLPKLPVNVNFDPAKNPGTSKLWAIPAGRILMLLWRPMHLCGADWFMLALKVARRIEAERPQSIEQLRACFEPVVDVGGFSDFPRADVREFCLESIEYFAGENSVSYTGEVSGVAEMEVLTDGKGN